MRFEVLYQELDDSAEMVRALLNGASQEDARRKPNEGSRSIPEGSCHLHDEDRDDFRERLDISLHRQSEELPLIGPQGWVVARKYNEQNLEEMKEKYFAERAMSLEQLKALAATDWDTTHTSEFRKVSAGETLSACVAHDNLHVRLLAELRRLIVEKITQPYEVKYAGGW